MKHYISPRISDCYRTIFSCIVFLILKQNRTVIKVVCKSIARQYMARLKPKCTTEVYFVTVWPVYLYRYPVSNSTCQSAPRFFISGAPYKTKAYSLISVGLLSFHMLIAIVQVAKLKNIYTTVNHRLASLALFLFEQEMSGKPPANRCKMCIADV